MALSDENPIEPQPPWFRRNSPKGGCRDFLPGAHGMVWMATYPRGDGTYLVEVGRSRRTRTAQRQSGQALKRLRQRWRQERR